MGKATILAIVALGIGLMADAGNTVKAVGSRESISHGTCGDKTPLALIVFGRKSIVLAK